MKNFSWERGGGWKNICKKKGGGGSVKIYGKGGDWLISGGLETFLSQEGAGVSIKLGSKNFEGAGGDPQRNYVTNYMLLQ